MVKMYYVVGFAFTWIIILLAVVFAILSLVVLVRDMSTYIRRSNWYKYHVSVREIPTSTLRLFYRTKHVVGIDNNKRWIVKYRLRNIKLVGNE